MAQGEALTLSLGMDVCNDTWEEVAISSGMTESALSRLSGSFASMEGGAPRAVDVDLLRVVCPGTEPEVSSMAHDSSL